VLGNLSLPSSGASRFAERVWLGALASRVALPPTDARDRFNSGLPAHLLAQALGLGGGAYALDAACASSLYAIERACRDLQAGRADRMLAGAVNRADDLFIHVGFCALGAMSRTGRSRPFHEGADGLMPGEGCGVVVLERLDDAVRAGRTIHGVIRGVGLANDGRGKNLLAPSEEGQARSMRLALQQAGLEPSDVAYVECHATGTGVGDATELASMRAVYGERPMPIGSLKANIGHLITAAGVAGLLKLLESLREGVFLPTPHLDVPSAALTASPFETLDRPTAWSGPPRAGLSAFGFGGNDAHLLVEAYERDRAFAAVPATPRSPVVVVGLGARVGDGQSVADFERVLHDGRPLGPAERVRIPMSELRFPPTDLEKASPQQTMLLAAALEAVTGIALPGETTGVFVGYGCDPQIARWGARWRARSWGDALGADEAWVRAAADAFGPPLEAPHVVGTLPNIPANRLSSQLALTGPSFTTSSEELSGIRALEIAVDGLRRGELDAAVVGAVDLSNEPVHQAALGNQDTADAAVVLVLRRRDDALRAGEIILGEIDVSDGDAPAFATGLPRAHAAAGLVEVAGALVGVGRGRRRDGSAWADAERRLRVRIDALGGQTAAVEVLARGDAVPAFPEALETPALELPVHPAPVKLPPIAAPVPDRPPMQKMAPAPALPPTSFDAPPAAPMRRATEAVAQAPAAPAASMVPALAAPTVMQASGMPTDIPPGSWLAAFTAQQLRLADAHRVFVEQQAALHQRFLSTLQAPFGAAGAESAPALGFAPSAGTA
ncbi:MAG TPA: 3-hydroxyacyl-[acyl-carrier-protein] dehydratase FabA, partial [Myxococcales bacterium]|nr:3-hydroxyacyl-[acyl-carrier-protein] dehydratase FabA [Myxococcales bacterium]